jgi:N-acetylmuramoyl-L-alanine amidase
MKLVALALLGSLLLAQGPARDTAVTGVRTWPTPEGTRVAIEVNGSFEYKYDRLQNPDRVYFDIKGATPRIDGRRIWSRQVTDKLVQRVRVAETQPGVTRVVVELTGPVDVTPSHLVSPNRLIIDMRPAAAVPATPTAPVTEVPAVVPPAPVVDAARVESKPEVKPALPPEVKSEVKTEPKRETPKSATSTPRKSAAPVETAEAPVKETPPKETPATAAELARGARRTTSGGSSLTRALGLKLNRIVLDAGHGGHDQGTSGSKGLLEKDLVLDVTLRLGKLIEEGLGAEVIYTRSDDTFIPLEGRTAIANEKKADLFLSIHANSSPVPRITGVETYYLNFTDSKEAMDLAARENAASQRSIFELQDLLQKITLHEKIDESREFANRVQSSLFALSTRNFPGSRNRGVKKAPFVVLIGAQMPSILAEIGFVTNSREEQLLKRGDYRQKIAESLYKGVSKYAESLSHFQVAQNQ